MTWKSSIQLRTDLIKESEAHVVVFFRLAFFLLCSSSWSCFCSRSSSSGRGSSSSKCAGISQERLHSLCLLEGDFCGSSNSQQIFHTIDNAVRHRSHSGILDSQGKGSYVSNTLGELG